MLSEKQVDDHVTALLQYLWDTHKTDAMMPLTAKKRLVTLYDQLKDWVGD